MRPCICIQIFIKVPLIACKICFKHHIYRNYKRGDNSIVINDKTYGSSTVHFFMSPFISMQSFINLCSILLKICSRQNVADAHTHRQTHAYCYNIPFTFEQLMINLLNQAFVKIMCKHVLTHLVEFMLFTSDQVCQFHALLKLLTLV